jgi:hypothetical protein
LIVSTNFYLHCDPKACETCDRPERDEEIHIGKRSVGWVFTWQGFPAERSPSGTALIDAETWRAFLAQELAQGAVIQSENGVEYTLEGFFTEVVEALRGQWRQTNFYPSRYRQEAGPDEVSFGEWF